MKKTRYVLWISILFCAPLFAQVQTLTNQMIHGSTEFSGKAIQGIKWINGGSAFSYQDSDPITRSIKLLGYAVESGKKELIIDTKDLKDGENPFRFTSYQWSPDEKMILFADAPPSRQYFSRHMPAGNLFIYSLQTRSLQKITSIDVPQYNQKFSPDGKKIGFVRDNNIYIIDLVTLKESQLTTDGGGSIINGRFDWVYEEEFDALDGWMWSPDGKRIAFWQLDEQRVPQFNLIDHLTLRSELKPMKYPKAGDPNSIVRVGVIDLESNVTRWMDIGSEDDMYIPRIKWMADPAKLCIMRVNRLQNTLELLEANIHTGKSSLIYSESEKTWIDVNDDLIFLKSAPNFLWSSERDGYSHLYLHDLEGKTIRQITKGPWDVVSLVHFDEGKNHLYFIGGEKTVFEKHLYSIKSDGTGMKRVTRGDYTYSINMSPNGKYFIGNYSNNSTPSKVGLFRTDGSLIKVLEENRIEALTKHSYGEIQFFGFNTDDGVKLNGWMIKPTNFDSSKKYPVLMYVYGGPGSQTVTNSWGGSRYLWHQMLAQKGYIVVSVDNRGTGMRGKEFKSITYMNLGKYEVLDQIEAVKYLRTLSFVDPDRIGIWGWSYGGYMASLSVLVGSDYFKTAVAVAPVTDWKFYDTIYTERFMRRPIDNEEGYRESAPIHHAKKMKGSFLLVHGTTDDNVHWQNSLQLADALQKADKQFESEYYANKNHGIGGGNSRVHLFERITRFLDTHLKGN